MSTKTGVAPVWDIASTVAMKVKGTVMTSSPGPIPAAIKAKQRASVPLLTPTQYSVSQNLVLGFEVEEGNFHFSFLLMEAKGERLKVIGKNTVTIEV